MFSPPGAKVYHESEIEKTHFCRLYINSYIRKRLPDVTPHEQRRFNHFSNNTSIFALLLSHINGFLLYFPLSCNRQHHFVYFDSRATFPKISRDLHLDHLMSDLSNYKRYSARSCQSQRCEIQTQHADAH